MSIDPGNLQFGQTKPPAPKKKATSPAGKTAASVKKTAGKVASAVEELDVISQMPKRDRAAEAAMPVPVVEPSAGLPAGTLPSFTGFMSESADVTNLPSLADIGNEFKRQEDITLERKDAFQFIINALKPYNLEGVGEVLTELMGDPSIGPAKAEYIIKYDTTVNPKTGKPYNDAYAKRFAGNFERIKNGLPAYSEGEYMAYENQYKSSLNALGYGNLATKAATDNWIAKTVSPSEVASRVELATTVSIPVQQVLKSYLPSIGTNDIVSALLDTTNGLPVLKQKIERAKIGAAASAVGFAPLTETRAEQLLQGNVTEAEAQTGFRAIKSGIERGRQLAMLQGEGDFTQTEAENLVFGTPGYEEAQKKAKLLASRERALMQGQTGLTAGALDTGRAGAY